jgi:superfamily II DNA helicase RecQ
VAKLLSLYLQFVIPFQRLINGITSIVDNVFLFGNENGPWATDMVSKALKSRTGKALGWEMTLQQFRHFGLAIERKHIRPRTSRGVEQEEGDSDSEDGVSNPWDKGASHSSDIAIRNYARESGFTKALTPDSTELCIWFSRRYHQFYDLLSVDVAPARANTAIERLLTRDEKVQEISRIMTLWYGVNYRWKSVQQQEATERVVSGISPLFIVLPTSAGKTTTFLLASKMKWAKTTVVITPLISLGAQLKGKCKEYGLDAELFEKGKERQAQVVIVVTETAGTEDFKDFIMELQLKKQLDRVVWDEVHMLVKDASYRATIGGSARLELRCQVVFVSATCPPCLVEEITELMAIPIPHVVRQEYCKLQFRYSVTVCSNLEESTKGRVDSLLEEAYSDTKILVFCKSAGEVKRWAQHYGARQYYSALRDKAQQWASWSKGLLFGTTAIGAGMDKNDIEYVVHIGDPYSLMGYVQESGRGGRGGEYVEAMILISEEEFVRIMSIPRGSLTVDEMALQDYLGGELCRNEVITKYLNGRGRSCVDLEAVECDVCEGKRKEGLNSGVKRRQVELLEESRNVSKRRRQYDLQLGMKQDSVRERIELWERIDAIYEEIGQGCAICWFKRDEEFGGHGQRDCWVWRRAFGHLSMGLIRKDLYVDYSGLKTTCWSCGVPGDKCGAYSNKMRCGRVDGVLPVVLYFWKEEDSEYHGVVGKILGRVFEDLRQVGKELVKKTVVLGENGSMAFKIWLEILKARDAG